LTTYKPTASEIMKTSLTQLQILTRYKSWANEIIFSTVASLPESESLKERLTRYKNMVYTLNHVYVIDLVFKAHLSGYDHGFSARNTKSHPPFSELRELVKVTDQWYVELSDDYSPEQLQEIVNFKFIGGGEGAMTREEMILHIVNHGTYHRGLVADMLYQVPLVPPSTDLPVFLREVIRKN
jgi:uncharacterized damage-inducible protein DinB